MGDRTLGRKLAGGLGVLVGLALVTWVIAGRPGLGVGDEAYRDVLSLLLAAILVGSGQKRTAQRM